jgi:hypothetical protein
VRKSVYIALSVLFVLVLAGTTVTHAIVAPLPKLVAPTPIFPAFHRVLKNVPRETTLAWSKNANAVSYTVTVYYSTTGASGSFTLQSTFTLITNTEEAVLLTEDGFYYWQVEAIGNGTTHSNSNPSAPAYFSFSTSLTLAEPVQVAPYDEVVFPSSPRDVILEWSPDPAVATGGAADGYLVYVQFQDPVTGDWSAVFGSPFEVLTTGADSWQNSSFAFGPATAKGVYRWGVQSIGNGTTIMNSPSPVESGMWFHFQFSN